MKHLARAIAIGLLAAMPAAAEDGYDLWLRYVRIDDPARLPIRDDCGQPLQTLEHYMSITHRYAPN